MKDKIKQRLLDLLVLIAGLAVVLGALHLYQRGRAHDALVNELIKVIQQSQPQQARPPVVQPEVPEDAER